MNWRCAAVSVLLWLAAPASAAPVEQARFATADGWTIVGTYRKGRPDKPVWILTHGVAAGRGEWDAFAEKLLARGIGSLAIDLRGHGESVMRADGSKRTFESFDAAGEWPRASADVLAAAAWLAAHKVSQSRLILAGGSIGANLSARAFTLLPKARGLVLLSAGMDYRGATLARFDGARALACAAREDGYAWATAQRLKQELPKLRVVEGKSGHGAQLLSDPAVARALLAFP